MQLNYHGEWIDEMEEIRACLEFLKRFGVPEHQSGEISKRHDAEEMADLVQRLLPRLGFKPITIRASAFNCAAVQHGLRNDRRKGIAHYPWTQQQIAAFDAAWLTGRMPPVMRQ